LVDAATAGDTKTGLQQALEDFPADVSEQFKRMLLKAQAQPSRRRRSNLLIHLAIHHPFKTALNALTP